MFPSLRKLFVGWGGQHKIHAHDVTRRACLRWRAPRRLALKSRLIFWRQIRVFPRSLKAVAAVAQGLKIGRICEQCHIPFVRDNVVNVRRRDAQAPADTFTTIRLACELSRPELFFPNVRGIEPSPACCRSAARIGTLRAVLLAPSAAHEHRASLMCARSQGLLSHGLSPPKKKQKRLNHTHPFGIVGSGAMAQALDIYDSRLLAFFTVNRKIDRRRCWQDFLICPPSTLRAKQKIILREHFTTLRFVLQYFYLPFF